MNNARKRLVRGMRSGIISAGLRFFTLLVRTVPARVAYATADALSRLQYRCAVRNRRRCMANIDLALGSEYSAARQQEIIRESWRTAGRAVVDIVRCRNLSASQWRDIPLEGEEHLKNALAGGKGVIAVSAHFGPFVMLGGRLLAGGYPVHFIARSMREKALERFAINLARSFNTRIIFTRPMVRFMRQSLGALHRNEILIIQVDQNFGSAGIPVQFFNRTAMIGPGPFTLAKRSGAPLVPMFLVQSRQGQLRVRIEPPIEMQRRGDSDDDRENGQRVMSVVERYVRRYPGQWLSWIHKQWRTPER